MKTSNLPINTTKLIANVKLDDFIGQEKIISDVKKRIEFSIKNKQPLVNIILSGSADMGKTTLASAIADKLKSSAIFIPSDEVKLVGDLASILTNLSPGDIVVLDDISNIKKDIAKIFYKAMETRTLDIIVGKGSSARMVQLDLPEFSVIATTPKPWQIDEKIRRWFVIYDFSPYSEKDIGKILIKLANIKDIKIDLEVAETLAQFCNGSPGNAEVIIKRLLNYIKVINPRLEINSEHLPEILKHLGLGENYPKSLSLADKFTRMSGVDFENWVADHFRSEGYEVRTTKTTGDHGIDLLLYKSNKIIGAVQCKNRNASVGEPTVRDFYGSLLNIKAPEGYIFTTASFTQQAKDFITDKPIKLVGLEDMVKYNV